MGRGRLNGGGSISFALSCEQQNQLRLRAKCTGDDHSSVKLSVVAQTMSSKMSLFLLLSPMTLASFRCCSPSRSRFNESLAAQQFFPFNPGPGDVQCMTDGQSELFALFPQPNPLRTLFRICSQLTLMQFNTRKRRFVCRSTFQFVFFSHISLLIDFV